MPYDKELEIMFIDALGGDYLRLNKLKGRHPFDDNPQNRELFAFLEKMEYPYLSKVFPPADGHIKVTFKSILKE